MNNRINELEKNLIDIQERIQKIQIEIENYQKISTEYLTENGEDKLGKQLVSSNLDKIDFENNKIDSKN